MDVQSFCYLGDTLDGYGGTDQKWMDEVTKHMLFLTSRAPCWR